MSQSHTLKCEGKGCKKEIMGDVYSLIGAGWQVIGAKAYCPKCREERK